MIEQLIKLLLTFLFTALLIMFLKPFAYRFGLIDEPGGRKQHDNATPMIGGVALFFTVTVTSLIWGKVGPELYYFLSAAALMVFTGAYDDRFGLGVRIRLLAEVIAACMMIFGAGVVLTDLGNLLGFGNIHMPMYIAVPFTIIAVFGTINCLNMIDGIDGLAAGLCLLSMCTFVILLGDTGSSLVPIISIIAGLGAFLAFNLQLYPGFKKIFLGDAGSMLLGFTLVWLLIRSSQDYLPLRPAFIEPATALFVLGLPLMDMVATTARRGMKGSNPFKPDRTHAHHLLLDYGLTSRKVLLVMLILQVIINTIGLTLHYTNVPEYIQLFTFIFIFTVYLLSIKKIFFLKPFLSGDLDARERMIVRTIHPNDKSNVKKKKRTNEF